MTSNSLSPEIYRVIDANLNRLKEGIRVIEDIMRYQDNNKELSQKLKSLRRDSINDVLRPSTKSEQTRTDLESILTANFKRAQESARVLEEIFKLENVTQSENFKTIRYELYNLEKEIILSE